MEQSAGKQPIGVLGALSTGFDTVTRQLWLLALPAGLELGLRIVPRLKAPQLWSLFATSNPAGLDMQSRLFIQQLQSAVREYFESFNWLAWLRPPLFGVPGLTSGVDPVDLNAANSFEWQVSEPVVLALIVLLLAVIGIGLGGLYWSLIARQARDGRIDWGATFGRMPIVWPRMLGLALLLVGLMAVTWLPVALLSAIFGAALDAFGALMVLAILSILTWLLFYLTFSIHGIVLYNQRVVEAVRTSIWLGRTHFWSVLGMVAAFIGIDSGMRLIWNLAPMDSWLWLAAVAGHAFVAAGLSMATMIFYIERVPIPSSALAPS